MRGISDTFTNLGRISNLITSSWVVKDDSLYFMTIRWDCWELSVDAIFLGIVKDRYRFIRIMRDH